MGATNCPETPRQRMIGMMYLVLTAMLALNVSKDILNAFSIVDETLHTTNNITVSKNNQDYAELNRQRAILGEEKVAEAFEKATIIKEASNEIVDYIEQLKKEFIAYVDGESAINEDGSVKSVAQLKAKDNISKAAFFMITEGRAKELKNRLEKYRELLISFVNEKDRDAMAKTIGLDVNGKYYNTSKLLEPWETHYFDGVIFAAGVTLLNKTVGEVRNAESGLLKYTLSSLTQDDFKFSNVVAKVIPKSQLVFQGEPYEAEVIVAAYDDKQPIEAYWRSGNGKLASKMGATLIKGDDGIAKLKIGTNAVGDFNFTGFIEMTDPSGLLKTYDFTDSYTVMAPSATAAADKMNVLYAGIDNPISVSASVAAEKISISLSSGTETKTGPGKYNVKVPESSVGKTVTINTFAEINGKKQPMASNEFRVKRVPDPTPVLGGAKFKSGKISKAEVLANPFVHASMGEDFVYDLVWTIKSYQVSFTIKGIEDAPITCNTRQFSDAIKAKINSSPAGTLIQFYDIKVSSAAGDRTLSTIFVLLK